MECTLISRPSFLYLYLFLQKPSMRMNRFFPLINIPSLEAFHSKPWHETWPGRRQGKGTLMGLKGYQDKVDLRKITLTIISQWSLLMHSYMQSFRTIKFLCILLSYPNSALFSLAYYLLFAPVSFSWETFYAGIESGKQGPMLSPYLCPDCSETWNHSPHYRWLSPENQKRSDWPQTHGENVCRDSSPLKNLFECHLRWKAPFLKEGGDTGEK